MPEIKGVLETLDVKELKTFLREAQIMTDDLSVKLMTDITNVHSPMPVSKLPERGFKNTNSALIRLHGLEEIGFLVSKIEEIAQGKYERIFYATALGNRAYT